MKHAESASSQAESSVASPSRLDPRARAASAAAHLAGWLSRVSGRGSGGMIGGEVAKLIDPRILEKAARGRRVVLVTGTNGKSTTTAMVRAALETNAPVASNTRGDNMVPGNLVALLDSPRAPWAALEVDELHLGMVADATHPAAFVLLNLSRDQLDRVGEITKVEKHLRQTLARYPQAWVIANVDDPLIVSAAWDAPRVIWVSGGCSWTADSVTFPRSGTPVLRHGDHWQVADAPQYQRPEPQWEVINGELRAPHVLGQETRRTYPLALQLPGRANMSNAAQAVAAAVALGIDAQSAVRAVTQVRDVAGRYARVTIGDRQVRLLLAKNPAGWQEAMTMIDPEADAVVLSVNGQIPDGQDLSWLWDVDFTSLLRETFTDEGAAPPARVPVIATGERGTDLAVRLQYSGIDCELCQTTMEAVEAAPPGRVDVLANYTALRDFTALLRRRGLMEG